MLACQPASSFSRHFRPSVRYLPSLRSLFFYSIVLCCVLNAAFASNRASWSGTEWTISYDVGQTVGFLGGLHANIPGHEGKAFAWLQLGPATVVVHDVDELLYNRSAAPLAISTNFTWLPDNSATYLTSSTTIDGQLYFMTSTGALLNVDPALLYGNNHASAVSNALFLEGSGPLLPLVHENQSLIVAMTGPANYAVINQTHWDGSSPVNPSYVGSPQLPHPIVGDEQFRWVSTCSINETYGYFIGSSLVNTYLFRVKADSPIPELAMVFGESWMAPMTGHCVYSADSDTFYLPLTNASIAEPNREGLPLLLKIEHWSQLDTGSGLVFDASLTPFIAASASSQSFSRQNALWSLNAAVLLDDGLIVEGMDPQTLLIDEIGGQAIFLLKQNTIARVNLATMSTLHPTVQLLGTGTVGNAGLFYRGLDTPNNRTLLAFGGNIVWKYLLPSACPDDCGESLSPSNGVCVAGMCQCAVGFYGPDCSCLDPLNCPPLNPIAPPVSIPVAPTPIETPVPSTPPAPTCAPPTTPESPMPPAFIPNTQCYCSCQCTNP